MDALLSALPAVDNRKGIRPGVEAHTHLLANVGSWLFQSEEFYDNKEQFFVREVINYLGLDPDEFPKEV